MSQPKVTEPTSSTNRISSKDSDGDMTDTTRVDEDHQEEKASAICATSQTEDAPSKQRMHRPNRGCTVQTEDAPSKQHQSQISPFSPRATPNLDLVELKLKEFEKAFTILQRTGGWGKIDLDVIRSAIRGIRFDLTLSKDPNDYQGRCPHRYEIASSPATTIATGCGIFGAGIGMAGLAAWNCSSKGANTAPTDEFAEKKENEENSINEGPMEREIGLIDDETQGSVSVSGTEEIADIAKDDLFDVMKDSGDIAETQRRLPAGGVVENVLYRQKQQKPTPPSMEELQEKLRGLTSTKKKLDDRVAWLDKELTHIEQQKANIVTKSLDVDKRQNEINAIIAHAFYGKRQAILAQLAEKDEEYFGWQQEKERKLKQIMFESQKIASIERQIADLQAGPLGQQQNDATVPTVDAGTLEGDDTVPSGAAGTLE